MFFNIRCQNPSSGNDREPQAPQTLILPSLEDCRLSSKDLKACGDAPLYARRVTQWCKSVLKNRGNISLQRTPTPTPTHPPMCPLHHAALWDGITYAFAGADEAFAAEEARRNTPYNVPHQGFFGALVALKSSQEEEEEPTHRSTHPTPALYEEKPQYRATLPPIAGSNDLFVARSALRTHLHIATIARITYKASLLIIYPLVALNATSPHPFMSAQSTRAIDLPWVCLDGRNVPRPAERSSVLGPRVAPLSFGPEFLAFETSLSLRNVALKAMPGGLAFSSTLTPEWFSDLIRPCALTSLDTWRSSGLAPSSTFRPHFGVGFPISAWTLKSFALSYTSSPSPFSLTSSPSSSSTKSCPSNDELFANSALSSPTMTTSSDEEEPNEKDWSHDLDHSLLPSPWNIRTKTRGADMSAGGGAPNPVSLSVPRPFVAARFLEDDVDTAILQASLVECQMDEGGEGGFEGWSDMGSVPDEMDPETSLLELRVDEDSEEFPNWSEMGSILDEADLDEIAFGPLTHRHRSIPLSVDSWLLDTAPSSQSFLSDASSEVEDRLSVPTIVVSPATTFDEDKNDDDDDDDDDDDQREDGWPFELNKVDQGWLPDLVEGVKSVTQFILDGLVEEEGDIFEYFDASLVEPEAVEDTYADIDGRTHAGSILDTTEVEGALRWSQNFTNDLAYITRFLLARLGPEDRIDFEISAVLQDDPTFKLNNIIASPAYNDPRNSVPIPVRGEVELVSTPSKLSRCIEPSIPSTPLPAPTGRYVEVSHGDSTSKNTERRAERSPFLSCKLSLLADMEGELIKKRIGTIYLEIRLNNHAPPPTSFSTSSDNLWSSHLLL
ncbi:hypothetical protein FRB98_005185 [Tulasnella sp. 332]|nr:hypothetical protein FRB98_005185 [Tulasnella sp. 332]